MNKKIVRNKTIIDKEIIRKKKGINYSDLYEYLNERNFNNIPELIEETEKEVILKLVREKKYYEVNEGVEFIRTVSKLHNKTYYYKDTSKNKYKEVYNLLLGNIEYLKEYYNERIEHIEEQSFMSPSNYLLARNYSIILSALNYGTNELKRWYKIVQNKTKERVCIVHNNLKREHFIKGDKNYLISWDNYLVDTPVLDLYKFYKAEGYKLDFSYLLNIYKEEMTLTEEEKILLNILISIPLKIEYLEDEYLNTKNIKNILDYMYSSVKVVNENK